MANEHSARETRITEFLDTAGWGKARRAALAQDASSRRYERLSGPLGRAMLMDAPPDEDAVLCPPEADTAKRTALGYTALARLAGSNTHAFAALAQELVARGFSAPQILAADHDHGLLLLEDLGDDMFSTSALDKTMLYGAATDTLAALCRSSFDTSMPLGRADWTVLDYDAPALLCETDLLLDWYAPYAAKAPSEKARAEVQALWVRAFAVLDTLPKVLVLRDVHVENLIWMPDRDGVAQTGLIDFQDALFGSPAYDLVSLLQDSRRDLPDGLEEQMLERFMEKAKISDRAAFLRSYAVLGAQRSAKVLGIFVRLTQRDHKPKYLDFLPITRRKMARALAHPDLGELGDWMRVHIPAIFEGDR